MTTRSIFTILIPVLLLLPIPGLGFELSSSSPDDLIIDEPSKCSETMPPVDISKFCGKYFTQNMGQWDTQVCFSAATAFGQLWLGRNFIIYDLQQLAESEPRKGEELGEIDPDLEVPIIPNIKGHVIKIQFDGSIGTVPQGLATTEHSTNYFIGNDSSHWFTNVPSFKKIIYRDLWEGVDLLYYFDSAGLKYEFILHPGSDPNIIKLNLEGHKSIKLNNNDLIIEIANDLALFDSNLRIFYNDSNDDEIIGNFELLNDHSYSFHISNYDSTKCVIIDPLIYSTLIGSSDTDEAWDIALDSNNNTYVTGDSKHLNFPHTTGAYDTTHNGDFDVVVFKLNPEGSALLYATFIGGSDYDSGQGIEIDSTGNVYITGYTKSDNFPNTTNAFDKFYNDGYDIFVLKLNSLGSDLIYSTFIGGTGSDSGSSIAVDSSGNAYVTGETYSTDFPVSVSAFDASHNGFADGFILKLNSTGSGLIYSTFIGGDNADHCTALEIDNTDQVYITGDTKSNNYPTTGSGYDTLFKGYIDAFVTKINHWGTGLIFSTYIGGIGPDYSCDIELDSNGNVYISGYTASSDFPTSDNAYDDSYNGANDVFVLKLNPSGSRLVYSTFVGGNYVDRGRDLVVDNQGNVYVTGETYSKDFPSAASNKSISDYLSDAFIFKLNSNGSVLLYSTFITGTKNEIGTDLELDSENNAFVSGYTESSDFPTTNNSYDTFFSGGTDMFVLKFNFEILPTAPIEVESIESNQSVYLTWEPPKFPGGSEIIGYKIYRGTISGNLPLLTTIGTITQYNDTNVTSLQTYYYGISAINYHGEGALSDEINATPMPIPMPPQNFQVLAGNNHVNLVWDPPISDGGATILRYNIHRGPNQSAEIYIANVSSNVFFYNDTTAINGNTYYYYVTAKNLYSESPPSQELFVRPSGPPSTPLDLQAQAGNIFILLTWQPPVNDGGFNIQRYNVYKGIGLANESFVTSVIASYNRYNDTSVTNGQTYFYYIRATNSLGESEPSNIVSAIPFGVPEAVENPKAVAGIGYINITWEEPINDGGKPIIEYEVHKCYEQYTGVEIIYVFDNSTFLFHDTNVSSNSTYVYWVFAVNSVGRSNQFVYLTVTPIGPPLSPHNIRISTDYGLLDIDWSAPRHDGGLPLTRYRIYRGVEAGTEEFLDSVSPYVTLYRDPNVTPGNTYYYYITAVNKVGESEPSSTISATPWAKKTVPSKPLALKAISGDGYVNLSWELPDDDGGAVITSYYIYRGNSLGNEVKLNSVSSYYKKFQDRNVVNGLTYYYYITSVNNQGESAPSDHASAIPLSEREVNNNDGTDGTDLNLLIAWLIMIIVIFIILFILAHKRRSELRKKSINVFSKKPGAVGTDIKTPDASSLPAEDSRERLRQKDSDGPERFG